MLKLSMKIALRPNKRFFFAFLGVAVCMMYVASTSSLVSGLREGNEMLRDDNAFHLHIPAGGPLDNTISQSEIEAAGVSGGLLGVAVRVSFENYSTYLVGFLSLDGEDFLSVENYTGVLVGATFEDAVKADNITLVSEKGVFQANAEGLIESPMFPQDWIVASPEFVRECGGYAPGTFSFFLTENSTQIAGLVSQPLSSSEAFFLAGIEQVESTLWFLMTVASLVAVLVVYNLMRVEVMARRDDIRVLQGIGGSRLWITSVFSLEGGVASLLGGLMGVVLGVLAANLLMSGFTLMGYHVLLTPYVGLDSIILPASIAFIVGIIGGGLAALSVPLKEAD